MEAASGRQQTVVIIAAAHKTCNALGDFALVCVWFFHPLMVCLHQKLKADKGEALAREVGHKVHGRGCVRRPNIGEADEGY